MTWTPPKLVETETGMSLAKAKDVAIHVEAKKHGWRQTQDGTVVSFVLHPNDALTVPELAIAPLGTRVILAVAQIGGGEDGMSEQEQQPETDHVQEAGRLCRIPSFGTFLGLNPDSAADEASVSRALRLRLNIASRTDLGKSDRALAQFLALKNQYYVAMGYRAPTSV